MSTEEMTRRIKGDPPHSGDGHARYLQVAWQRVARDAQDLAAIYEQARVPTETALLSATAHHRDQEAVAVWLLTPYRPAQRVRSRWGWRARTETIPEVLGIALLEDATLYAYLLSKGQLALSEPLCDAKPDAPPSRAMFLELAAKVSQPPG